MNYRAEFFRATHWADLSGLVFATRDEATCYAKSVPNQTIYRITATSDRVNYAFHTLPPGAAAGTEALVPVELVDFDSEASWLPPFPVTPFKAVP